MAIETGTPGTSNALFSIEHLPLLLLIPGQGSRLPSGSLPDEDTPKRDRRAESRLEPNGNRLLPLKMPSNPYKKRKTSQMEDSGGTYEAAHFRPSMKVKPGMPIYDSPSSSRSTSPGAFPIKQTLSIGKVLPGHSSANGYGGTTIFGPSSKFHKPSAMPRKESERPGNHWGKASNVEDRRASSSLTEPSMWDVSESEMHTTDVEEESSEGEGVGSDFSPGMDRQESIKSEEVSSGSDYLHQGKSNHILNEMGTVQDQNYIPNAGPTEPAANGHDRTEQNTPQNRSSHNHEKRVRDESDAIPANGVTGQNNETTVRGEPRKRAAAKTHMSTRDISRSWKTASPADKMLMKMKRKGCGWMEIRTAWQELTGEWPAPSTLPNRYSRIKDNITRLEPGDVRVSPEFHRFVLLCSLGTACGSRDCSTRLYSWARRSFKTRVVHNSCGRFHLGFLRGRISQPRSQ